MSELLPEQPKYFTYEEQYRVAGWKATIDIMAEIGIHQTIYPKRTKTTTLERLCEKANKEPTDILPFVKTYYKPPNHLDPTSLTSAGILLEKRFSESDYRYPINPDFEMAVIVFNENDDFAREARHYHNLDRLQPYIKQMAGFYIPKTLESFKNGFSLSETIQRVHHDSTFYIGMHDNDDQLGVDHIF